jgi:glutathione S-transferase
MTMTLYTLSGSPFGWKAQLALEHRGVPYALKHLSADSGDLRAAAFLRLSPHGKLPVLVDGDFALYESDAIVEYLEEGPGGAKLWPEDLRARARSRRIAIEASTYLYPPTRALVKEWAQETPREAVVGTEVERIAAVLALFASEMKGPYFAGESPTGADYAVYPLIAILKRLHARKVDYDLIALIREPLASWSLRVEALPFFDRTYPPHWRSQ